MPVLQDPRFVMLNGGTVIYENLADTTNDNGKFVIRAAFPPGHPDVALMEQLGQSALQQSEFRGQMPAGGNWFSKVLGPEDYDGMFNGWTAIKFTSKFCQIYDENGGTIPNMQWAQSVFPGQKVNVVADAWTYNNVQKGVGAGMDGVQVVASAGAQRLAFSGGGGGVARNAFGGQQQQQQYQPQQQQQQQQYQPQGNNNGQQYQPQGNNNGQQYQPQGNNNGQQYQPQGNNNGQQYPQQGNNNGQQYQPQGNNNGQQYPQQAQNFLPNGQ